MPISPRRSRTCASGKGHRVGDWFCRTRLRQAKRRRDERHPQVVATIAAWAEAGGYDAAIWTALESNFDEWDKAGEPFSVTAAIRYLEGLNAKDPAAFARAWDYIKKAPAEVETPVRDAVAKRWPA